MRIGQLLWWRFTTEPTEGCELRCPTCGEFSHHTLWTEVDVPCEDCGDHAALCCPKCGDAIDHVYQDEIIEVRNSSA